MERVWGSRVGGNSGDRLTVCFGFSEVVLVLKNLTANAGDLRDTDLIPEWGRSPGGGHGNPLHILAWRI